MDITEKLQDKEIDLLFESSRVDELFRSMAMDKMTSQAEGPSQHKIKSEAKAELKRLASMSTAKLLKYTEKSYDKMMSWAKKNGKDKDILKALNKKHKTNYKNANDVKIMNVVKESRMKYDDTESYYRFVANIKRGFGDIMAALITAGSVVLTIGAGALATPGIIATIVGGVVFFGCMVAINHMIPYEAQMYHDGLKKNKINYSKATS